MQNRLPNDTPAGWLARAVGAVLTAVIAIGLLFLGLTVFAAAAGLALVVFLVVAARVWWLRRRFRAAAARQGAPQQGPGHGVTLEGEYEKRDDQR